MGEKFIETQRKAKDIEPKIISWDHEGNPNFIYAQYRVNNFGSVVGIRLSDYQIIMVE